MRNPLDFLILMVAGWINPEKKKVISYLQAENAVLREQLASTDRRPRRKRSEKRPKARPPKSGRP